MSSPLLPDEIRQKVAKLYGAMQEKYDEIAGELSFTCNGCPDNCCDSYFQHHTHLEWAYLWVGLRDLSADKFATVKERASEYDQAEKAKVAEGGRPELMCPLCVEGLCSVYTHRLLICRLHGVPTGLTQPDGKILNFPGCFRCQEITEGMGTVPRMDRTGFYQDFMALEKEWLGVKQYVVPKVKLTIAEMILKGEPDFSYCDF